MKSSYHTLAAFLGISGSLSRTFESSKNLSGTAKMIKRGVDFDSVTATAIAGSKIAGMFLIP